MPTLCVVSCPALRGWLIRLWLNALITGTERKEVAMRAVAVILFSCLFFPSIPQAAEVPGALLEVVARLESGMNPLAVNVEGKTFFPADREEAEGIIRKAREAGKSYDVGLFQINSWWIERYGIPPESLLDAKINRQWGMFIMADEIARHGLTWMAVGKYHSPDVERARRYAWKVYERYAGTAKEREHGKAANPQNLSHGGGIWRNPGIGPQGGIVPFHFLQESMPGQPGSKPGASGGPDGTAKD